MQSFELPGDPKKPKSKKIAGTGLSIYEGGFEKTPTGKSNAFLDSGLTPEEVVVYAKNYGLPVSSNKEFQQAAIDRLSSTPLGQQYLAEMQKVYGATRAGTFVDDILGARTKYLLQGLDNINKNKEVDQKNYLENRPYLQSATATNPEKGFNASVDWAWDFGKDKKAYEEYLKYNPNPTFQMIDSARQGLSPKGTKLLNKMQAMQKLNEDTEANRAYFNKYGEFPYPMFTSPKGTTDKKQLLSDFLKFRYGNNYKID
jgi:hypothetical protein